MTIKAVRSGETVHAWSHDPYDEKLVHERSQFLLSFWMPSMACGTTEVQLRLTSDSFEAIAMAMMAVDEEAAI